MSDGWRSNTDDDLTGKLFNPKIYRIMNTWGILDRVSIDNLDRHLYWRFDWYSVDTRKTLKRLDRQPVCSWESVGRLVCTSRRSIAYLQKLVNFYWLSTEMLIGCWLSIDGDVNGVLIEMLNECRLKVSLDTQPRMRLVYMIWYIYP